MDSAHCKASPFREPGPEFFANHPNPHIYVFDEMARSEHAFGYPKMPMFAQASTEMLFLLENVLRGVRGPDEVIRMTQQKIGSIVSEYQRMAAKRRQAQGQGG